MDVYHRTGHLSPAAQDARYAFPGGRQGDGRSRTSARLRELRTNSKNKASLNDAGGLWGICSDHLVDDVQAILDCREFSGNYLSSSSHSTWGFLSVAPPGDALQ